MSSLKVVVYPTNNIVKSVIKKKWVQLGALAVLADYGFNDGRGTKKVIRTAKKFFL